MSTEIESIESTDEISTKLEQQKKIYKSAMLNSTSIIVKLFKQLFRVTLSRPIVKNIITNPLIYLNRLFDEFPIEINDELNYKNFDNSMEGTLTQPFSVYDISVSNIPMAIVWERSTIRLKKRLFNQLLLLNDDRQKLIAGDYTEIDSKLISRTKKELLKLLPENLHKSKTIDNALNFVQTKCGGNIADILNGDFGAISDIVNEFSKQTEDMENIGEITSALLIAMQSNKQYGNIFKKYSNMINNSNGILKLISSGGARERESAQRRKRITERRQNAIELQGIDEVDVDEYLKNTESPTDNDWLSDTVPHTTLKKRKKNNTQKIKKHKKRRKKHH